MGMLNLQDAVESIIDVRRIVSPQRSVLVAVSGIDGGGKGYVTARIVSALEAAGIRTAGINIDGWLNLPHKRFNSADPAAHFYRHAIRFDALFAELVLPLRERRSLRLEADYAEETADDYRKHLYMFEDIEVIVL